MLKTILVAALVLVSSSAFAGIIGVGGTNANEHPEILEALRSAKGVEVRRPDFRRLSVRIGVTGQVNSEVTTTSGEKIRKDFIKVFHNGEEKIVDTDITLNLEPVGPARK